MDFSYSAKCEAMRAQVRDFMDDHVAPRLGVAQREADEGRSPFSFMDDLKALAKSEGLWNLFLPGLRADEPGQGLSNLDYAPVAEIMGRVDWASEAFNCSAPDTGNMELLHMFATPEPIARSRCSAQWASAPIRRLPTSTPRAVRCGLQMGQTKSISASSPAPNSVKEETGASMFPSCWRRLLQDRRTARQSPPGLTVRRPPDPRPSRRLKFSLLFRSGVPYGSNRKSGRPERTETINSSRLGWRCRGAK